MKVSYVAYGEGPEGMATGAPSVRRIRLQEGIVYATEGRRRLALDVALPEGGAGPHPLLLVFPGNGWGYFFWYNRRDCRKEIVEAAARGFVAAAIDYRSALSAGFAGGLGDARRALAWLTGHAHELDADPERIAVTGFSSGGQLALLLALSEPKSPLGGESTIRAVVSIAAPTDLSALSFSGIVGLAVRRLFGGRPDTLESRYRRASAVECIRRSMPPVLVLHGTRDRVVPVSQSLALNSALSRAKVRHRLVLDPRRGHRDQWDNPIVWRFLSRELVPCLQF